MAGTGAAMRYERIARLNTGTAQSPVWSLMGTGFESLDDARNANVDSTQYVSDVSATNTVTGYSPELSFDGTVIKDDAVVEKLRAIGLAEATGAAAEVEIVEYDLWEVSAVDGTVPARKRTMTVVMDSVGTGAGGEKLGFSGTLQAKGDAVDGTYDTDTNTFVEAS